MAGVEAPKKAFHPVPQHPFHMAKNRANGCLAAALTLLLAFSVRAADWPQFRGPNRDNVWNETGILQTFPAKGLKVRWRAAVGPGWSSPVVVRGRVYLTDMRLAKPRAWERIQCFKESNGKRLWSRESELVYPEWAFIPEHGGGPAATPIVGDGKVYWYGRSGQVDCLDTRSGKVVWETHLDRRVRDFLESRHGRDLLAGSHGNEQQRFHPHSGRSEKPTADFRLDDGIRCVHNDRKGALAGNNVRL